MIGPIFLHIGMPKTGTSSIQQYLRNNRLALKRRGFVVPTTLGRLNHEHVTLYALADKDKSTVRRRHGLTSVATVRDYRLGLLKRLTSEAEEWSDHEAIVVSGEHMSMLGDPADFGRLKELLNVMGCNRPVRVVVYLRRQDQYCLSGYSQRIKGGASLSWSELTNDIGRAEFNYEKILERWKNSFGRANIVVRVFERGQWVDGELIPDFMSVLGCPIGPDFGSPIHKNESLDARSLEFLRRINRWYPRVVAGRLNPDRQALVAAMHRISEGSPVRMKREVALQFEEYYKDSNARVAMEYLGRSDGKLFRVTPSDEPERPPAMSMDDAIEICAKMWAIARNLDLKSTSREAKSICTASRDQDWL